MLVPWDTPEAPLGVWGHPLAHPAKGTLPGSPPGTSVSAGQDILGLPLFEGFLSPVDRTGGIPGGSLVLGLHGGGIWTSPV